MKAALITLGSIFGVIVVLGLGIYGKANGINNTAVDKESRLSAQYLDNQNYLSAYISGFYEQTGLAQAKSAQMDKILTDAVKGRYDNAKQGQGGQMFSAMVEAYPDLSQLNVYDRVMEYVQAGREGYRQQQSKLLDMLRDFDKWRNTGLVNKQLVQMMGVPGHDLKAQIGDKVIYGEAAEKKMYQIVLASSAKKAYETGTLEPLKVPGQS